ncbi:MAG: glycoside hydrolase family 38 C-terminal domain-containing protein, partial [Candidatus Sumerlaeota bacterium]
TKKKRKVHYALSTHWDREWYEPFQFFRYRLVQLFDRVLDGLEDGRLVGPFQTDGQSILLDDYLEVRPERRAQIERFAREGKLAIGPWYVLPDEFLVSGEAHIRNIRLGRAIARSFGTEPSNVGFVCDLFGHISQLPQIFAGFGIESAFLWRGVNADTVRHFVWRGADGSELVGYKFCNVGYCDYAFKVRDADKFDVKFDRKDKEEKLSSYLDFEASETKIDPILIFDGGDHQEWDQEVYSVLREKLSGKNAKYTIEHTSLDEYAVAMIAQRKQIRLRLSGELREPGRTPDKASHLIPGVLSSRVWIKQQNAACQNALCMWVEPLAAFANRSVGQPIPQSFIDLAWKYLLQNHPHDSICGCSIDQVHEDMKYRFSQCAQISERLILESTRVIAASVDTPLGDKELRVVVFNPLSYDLNETVELVLDTPEDWPTFAEFFNFESKPAFRIYDDAGVELRYQRVAQTMKRARVRIRHAHFPLHYYVNEVKVSLAMHIPALGYTTLIVRPGTQHIQTRHPQDTGIAASSRSLENNRISVLVESNGTLTITDKKTKNVYRDLLTFEERADIGDGWFHGIAANDEIHVSSAASADVSMIENGPNVGALRVRTTMRIPREFIFSTMRRSEERIDLIIDSVIRLRPGKDCVEVETTIENNADDHRVRVILPSNATAKTFIADTPFDVIERSIALRTDNHEYTELEVETKPQQSFTAVFDKKRGLAVVSTGQMESTVCDQPDRPIAMTLFRGTRRTVMTNGEPNGQLRGKMTFRYFVKVLTGAPHVTELFQLGQKIAGGIRVVQQRSADVELHATKTKLPPRGSFASLEGDAVLTSLRDVSGALEARVFNPLGNFTNARLRFEGVRSAELVDFESKPSGEIIRAPKSSIALPLKPKRIATVRIK